MQTVPICDCSSSDGVHLAVDQSDISSQKCKSVQPTIQQTEDLAHVDEQFILPHPGGTVIKVLSSKQDVCHGWKRAING